MSSRDAATLEIDGSIAFIRLNRRHALNALNPEMLSRLTTLLDEARVDPEVRGVVVTGAGNKAFSAGADIRFMEQASVREVYLLARQAIEVNRQIETFEKVIVAALNGLALGGGLELAEACHLRVASDHVRLGHPEVRIGAIAGWGGTTRLPRLIGRGRAAELLLTGQTIDAQTACDWGLVNKVVPPGEAVTAAVDLLRQVLSNAPIAVELTWKGLHRGSNQTLEESAMLGADLFGIISSTSDFKNALKAFGERRSIRFEGK
ncbi:MAG: enoyl-CoA hydratase/isomerase family protein [Dehalococcoidia bacterium]